jgi:integrase/recombinase XerD
MEHYIEKYKKWLSINDLSYNTRRNYIYRLNKFLEYLGNIENLTQESVENFLMELKQNSSNSTVNGNRAMIQSFLVFMKKSDIQLPKYRTIEKKVREYMTEEFFENEFLPIVEDIFKKDRLKMITVFSFLFYTGLRVEEFCKLKRENIDLDKCRIRFHNKKSKIEKIIPFPRKIKGLLESYFIENPEKNNAFNICVSSIDKKCKKLKPHFKLNIKPHLFRHSYASHLVNKGVSMPKIQSLLGHSNILTTQIYSHVNIEAIEKEYREKIG